ncbi:hypothetical protein EUGRSUZ_E00970 [Eucalyptus grandis]|uniref:Uncharacterized protein n=2 Tax=Eucalyptus grandis TaxID=71139 RepID=A0ACC3KPF1_EUCGR|nr:hypothetical protein EUGRSUZ_E00970 [Eucalyptus grandis]
MSRDIKKNENKKQLTIPTWHIIMNSMAQPKNLKMLGGRLSALELVSRHNILALESSVASLAALRNP